MDETDTRRRVLIGVGWMAAWQFSTRILGFVTTLILARLLVPADFGLVAVATSFAAAIEGLSQFALTDALVRRPDDVRHLYDTTFTLQFGRSLLTATAIGALAPATAAYFGNPLLLPIVQVLAGLSFLNGLTNIGTLEYKKDMDYRSQLWLLAVPRLIQVSVTFALALTVRSYWILIVGIGVAKVTLLVMGYVMHPYRPRFALKGWREIMGFSIWNWATSLALIVWVRGDPIILGPVLGTAALGAYLLGLEIAILPVSELLTPAMDVFIVGFSKAQRSGTAASALVLETAAISLMAVMPLTIGLSCTGGYVVALLLGARWQAAQHLVMVAAFLCLFSPLSHLCMSALVATARVRTNFIVVMTAALVRLVVLLITVRFTTELTMIAGVQVLCIGAESVFYLLGVRTEGPLDWRRSAGGFLRIGAAGAATAAVMWQTGLAWHEVTMPPVMALLRGLPIGLMAIAVYAVIHGSLWLLAGRPAGPETRGFSVVRSAAPGWLRARMGQ